MPWNDFLGGRRPPPGDSGKLKSFVLSSGLKGDLAKPLVLQCLSVFEIPRRFLEGPFARQGRFYGSLKNVEILLVKH